MSKSLSSEVMLWSMWLFWVATLATTSDIANFYGMTVFLVSWAGYIRFEKGMEITQKHKDWAFFLIIFSGIPSVIVLVLAPSNFAGAMGFIVTLLLTAISTLLWLDFFDQLEDLEPRLEEAERLRDAYKNILENQDFDMETVDFTEIEDSAEYNWRDNDYRMEVQTQ